MLFFLLMHTAPNTACISTRTHNNQKSKNIYTVKEVLFKSENKPKGSTGQKRST